MAHVFKQTGGWYWQDKPMAPNAYAGHGEGLNNPDMDDVHDVGPLPEGAYGMGHPFDHSQLGHYVIPLIPSVDNTMHGRGSFYLHGDKLGHVGEHIASDGCVIASFEERQAIYLTGDRQLLVVSGKV